MDDFINPRRQYRNMRPRQAARGRGNTGVPVNLATTALFNNSTGPSVLVVRDVSAGGTAGDVINVSFQRGQIGVINAVQTNLVSGEQQQSGLMYTIDTATAYVADYIMNLSSQAAFWWQHDFPFAVVLPNFSLVFQCGTAAHATVISLIWESIVIDELDWAY